MPGTAGFAAVGCVGQDVINSALRVAQANFAPPFTFTLPGTIPAGNTPVSVSGLLMLVAPQVTLQTRADNLVSVTVGFAGQLTLTSGNQVALNEVLLSATVLVGLAAATTTSNNTQQVTVGLNLANASVTAIDVTVLTGPALAPLFTGALTSGPVLAAMTAALQAVPPGLTQVTPQGINLPQQIVQTYQPPYGSTFSPETLFQLQFAVSDIAVRPLTSNSGNSGVIAVGVDVSAPVATTGDASALADLTSPLPTGPTLDYGGSPFSPGGGELQLSCDMAVYIDSAWVTSIVNSIISPQLAGKFLQQAAESKVPVSFSKTPQCVQISFEQVSAALSNPTELPIPNNIPMAGMNLTVQVTAWAGVTKDGLGYYSGQTSIAPATFQAQMAVLLMENEDPNQAKPQLPALTNDYFSAFVIGSSTSVPWWVTAILGAIAPVYVIGSSIAGLLGVDIFLQSILAEGNSSTGQGLQSTLGGLFQAVKDEMVVQLPGTTTPNWELAVVAMGTASDACFSCVDLALLPPGVAQQGEAAQGSFPYLMLTDQPVSDPSTVPDTPGYPFPVRFDGAFTWPGISYNQPGYGAPGGNYSWNVHDTDPIGVVLKMPAGLFSPNDPTVVVSWTVVRTDTNAQVVAQTLTLGALGALAVSIPHASAALQAVSGFQINCVLTRKLAGGGTETVFDSGNVFVNIPDIYDRSHPYVTWSGHTAYCCPGLPFWQALRQGETKKALTKTVRGSRIHRTDWWSGGHRCLVADTTGLMGRPPRKGRPGAGLSDTNQIIRTSGAFTYLDQLPISLAQVAQNRDLARGVLCDYCFFGGPTKKTLRTDFP